MSGINTATIVGRMGQDPEVRYTANGDPVANLSIATSKKYKGEEETEWHRVVCFGKMAGVCQQYVHKGDLIGSTGEIRTRKWQDKQGQDRYSTEIIAHNMQMLGSKGTNTGAPPDDASRQKPAQPAAQEEAVVDDGFDDIPF